VKTLAEAVPVIRRFCSSRAGVDLDSVCECRCPSSDFAAFPVARVLDQQLSLFGLVLAVGLVVDDRSWSVERYSITSAGAGSARRDAADDA